MFHVTRVSTAITWTTPSVLPISSVLDACPKLKVAFTAMRPITVSVVPKDTSSVLARIFAFHALR
jgi:hypothetical protein